jgi:ubiquinone/menaquinone biosynthesis C-methylase UbiE
MMSESYIAAQSGETSAQEEVVNGFRRQFNTVDFHIDVDDYRNYLDAAGVYNNSMAYGGPGGRAFPEKTLEHYVAARLLDLGPDDVYIDIASQSSPASEGYARVFRCKIYRQDLVYPAGLNGNKIGSDAAAMPVPDGFATAMGLHCSFEHFENDADMRFIKEVSRVLRPGGRVCILPLYVAEQYTIQTDPAVWPAEGIQFEPDAIVTTKENWKNRWGRWYDVEHFGKRIAQNLNGLKLPLFAITNAKEVHPSCGLRLAMLLEKPRETIRPVRTTCDVTPRQVSCDSLAAPTDPSPESDDINAQANKGHTPDSSPNRGPEEFYFDGNCMVPMQSWNARMELEHWNRYMAFQYLAESKNVLDIACGEGYGTDLLASIARTATGVDLAAKNIDHANDKYAAGRGNLKYIAADGCNLPMEAGSIEVLYSFETIEHLENIPAFLSSLSRVLSCGGVGIISTPRPNINPRSGKPYNPFHMNELSVAEFESHLSNHFKSVVIAGQSGGFPCEIHRDFDDSRDAYAIGIVSNDEDAVQGIARRLPDASTLSIRERLFERHLNQARNFPKPLRVLFVPLTSIACDNPADRRRVLLPADYLRHGGAEVAVVNKEDVLSIRSDVVYSQDRSYEFWLANIDRLKNKGVRLVFSFSDALAISTRSKTRFEAFSEAERYHRPPEMDRNLKSFLKQCCFHVFAGSDEQKRLISEIAPDVSVSVLYDPIDTETYNSDLVMAKRSRTGQRFTLIWEGFVDNVPYLLVCAEALKRLSARIPLKVIVVTSQTRRDSFLGTVDNEELARKILGDMAEFHVWDATTISELMAQSDAGLAPLFMDCQFAVAKPANKAVIYNYMKLPVIASPTIGFKAYIADNLNGFIAETETDWEKCIEYLYANPDMSLRIGEVGHQKAKVNFSVDAIAWQMLDVFQKIV